MGFLTATVPSTGGIILSLEPVTEIQMYEGCGLVLTGGNVLLLLILPFGRDICLTCTYQGPRAVISFPLIALSPILFPCVSQASFHFF